MCGLASVPAGAGHRRTTLLALMAAVEVLASAGLRDAGAGRPGVVSATASGGRPLVQMGIDEVAPDK